MKKPFKKPAKQKLRQQHRQLNVSIIMAWQHLLQQHIQLEFKPWLAIDKTDLLATLNQI